jgi:hypothetical protein
MHDGIEDPAAGLAVVRSALHALYAGDIVDISSSTDLLGALPQVMDRALADTPSCPFNTFEESLAAFARTVYALGLEGGRCTAPGLPAGCGFYDPDGLYGEPPVHWIVFSSRDITVTRTMEQSYAMAFVHLMPGDDARGRPVTIEIETPRDGAALLNVQVWQLSESGLPGRLLPAAAHAMGPAVLGVAGPGSHLSYSISLSEATKLDRIGLIITRVDVDEEADPVGAYTIRVTSAAPSGAAAG